MARLYNAVLSYEPEPAAARRISVARFCPIGDVVLIGRALKGSWPRHCAGARRG